MCDEVGVHVEQFREPRGSNVYSIQIVVEEFLENLSREAASKPGVVWSEDRVRLYIAGEMKKQVSSWVDEIAVGV